MKVTKKLLSVLLAVMMIVSSMSVCFGTITASAASLTNSTFTQNAYSYLAEHLSSNTITNICNSINIGNGGKSGNANSTNNVSYTTNIELATYEEYCEVRDILMYLDKAIKESNPWKKTENTQDSQSGSCAGAQDIYDYVKGQIERYGTLTTHGDEFIKFVLDYSKAVHHDKSEKITKSWVGKWGSVSKVPARHTTTVNIYTSDYKGYLAEVGEYTNVESGFDLGVTYSFIMRGDLYYSTYNIIGSENARYYHNMVWIHDTPINAPSANKSNTEAKSKVDAYVNKVDNIIEIYNFDTLAGLGIAGIESVVNELHTARTNIKTYVNNDGLDNYSTLFPGIDDKIDAFEVEAEKAKAIAKYAETVAEITDYQTNNPDYGVFNWGSFDEATIKADYAEFMGKYGSIINDATLYDYFVRQGKISDTYIKNFHDNVVAYDLEDLKNDKVIPLYDKYAISFPMEGGEEFSLAEKQSAYSELSGYINNIYSYTAQVQNAIFPAELMNHILDLQEKLECQVSDCVVYFAENVNKDYSDVVTEDVINEIASAKDQLAALNALAASIDYADNSALLDSAFANADEFIAYLYSFLAERFTSQVNAAEDAYNALNRPTSLDLSAFSKLNVYLSAIEETIMTYLDEEGKGDLISAETRAIYAALKAEVFPAFDAFLVDRGFNEFKTSEILIRREDDSAEYFRVNENLDDDLLGEYEVTDENVEAIIDLLEALLNDPQIKKILGDLVNKDENGNPTGEAFDLAALITGLIEDNVYSDALINTIVQFIYPAVANIFSDVWADIKPIIDDDKMDVMGQTVDVLADLYLKSVEEATAGLGLPIFPKELATKIRNEYSQFSAVADVLDDAKTKAIVTMDENGKPIEETRKSPWNDAELYTAKLDKDNNPVVNEETGETTMVLNLNWGIDTAENKRERFLQAAQAALCGLEPVLLALLCNKPMSQFNNLIGTGEGELDNFYVDALGGLNLWDIALDIYQIDLVLNASANDGYNNVIAPLFEMLNVTAPDGQTFKSTRDVLEKGILQPLDAFIAKLAANPIQTILDLLPNLAYAADADLLLTKLDYLCTYIDYHAGAYIDADVNVAQTDYWLEVPNIISSISGIVSSLVGLPMENGIIKGVRVDDVVNGELPVEISSFLDVGALLGGVDLSSFAGLWNMISGLVPMLADVSAPDASYLATLGTLVEKPTVRSIKSYTAGTAGKAYYIQANRADVLQYLIQWVLESGLLGGIVKNPEGVVADIFAAIEENPNDAIAAIVELLNQQAYPAKQYDWYDGTVDGESVVGNSAYEIYLNPGNDWTKEKAEYLYNNIDALLTSILALAGTELDLGATISGAVDGLLTDKTLTSLAALLAKLDLNELLNKDKTEEEKAKALDVNALVKTYLGLDLAAIAVKYADIAAAVEANPEYVHNFGVDAGEKTFAEVLVGMLEPLSVVLDYLLEGGDIDITIGNEKVTLVGAEGYNNAIIPLLEALGCDVKALGENDNALEATINALVARIDALTTGDVIKNIIDLLPGVFYFITSNGLSTAVMNLLQPVLTIVDTIRPVFDVMDLINNLEIGDEGAKQTIAELLGGEINLKKIDLGFIFDLLPMLVPAVAELDLTGVNALIYDICNNVGVEYNSASDLQETWKKGAYSAAFDQADLLTVVLSFVLEWATIEDNAKKLDEMLGTNGLIENIGKVFEDVEITYGTPEWYYWFEDEAAFDAYIAGNEALPNTLAALTYPNDWSEESAQYIADNLASLVDMVIGLIEIDGVKYESLSALVGAKLDVFNAETINTIVGLITNLLKDVDENLLSVGYLLDVDIVGLKNYTCTAEINDVESFAAELANVLDTYAGGLVNWLFFGDDFRFAKKSDNTDTIVINGGLGYEKGLALVLEALGCELPEKVTTESVLLALANRVDAILGENMVNEVIDMLPNLVYFLNANGASVAVNNLLAPVYALLDKLAAVGVNLDLTELLGFDLKYLSLEDILDLVKDKTGLDLEAAEKILVDLCIGKIEKAEFTYKMTADRKDTVTVVLTTALMLVKDEDFAAKLEEMMGTDLISAIKTVFESAPVTYGTPDWYALDENDIDYDNATIGVIKYAIEYPNNWTEESAKYVADNLVGIGDMVAGLIDSNYDSLGALLGDKVNIYTPDTLKAIQKLLGDLLGGLDADLKELVNVGLGAADALLGADVQGLLDYDVSGVKDKETFVAALTGMLMEVEGLVDWLLLGQDYEFFVDDKNENGTYDKGEQIITINGGHGYAEGLALVLEALGVENLPDVYAMEKIDTEAVVSGVLAAAFNRLDAILANPVEEVFNILPNVLYFINANGLTVAVDNLIGAINALLIKLEVFGIELDIASLVNFSDILGVETELALDNLSMAAIIELVAELTGLNLDKIADVLNGFALGRVAAYDSISAADISVKMYYHDDFAKYDMITVVATLAIITLTDAANAEKVKGMLGEDIYQLILNLINMGEVPVQEFSWLFTSEETGGNKVGETFSALETSLLYSDFEYGPTYTEEMAQYIADNFGDFVNNIIYLLGLDLNGDGNTEATLTELINGLLGGSLYNSANVIAIRDALAGVLANLTELKVNDKVVGGLIADVLKTTGVADINAVAEVNVPEFTDDRDKFVEYLCDVLEPLYGVLKFVLADEDISFFVNMDKTDAITLKGAEGYAYGIIPLLETLDCKDILAPADYYAAVEADGDVLLTSILNPLLNRVDEILADDPAQAILDILPNLVYFINSNGVDTVVKNTLNAVYTLLNAIEPIAKVDLYELIGIDLAEIDFEWLFDKLLDVIADATGYEFADLDVNAIAELTVGTLEEYTSLNTKTAYRMVYAEAAEGAEGASGSKTEMVTVVMRLLIRFIMHENNQELVLGLLRDNLGMSGETDRFVTAVLALVADCAVDTHLGMDAAMSTLYYLFYGADLGVDNAAGGYGSLNEAWRNALEELRKESDIAADLIESILGLDIFEDIIDTDGVAPNGFLAFFQKIIEWFKGIIEWFKNLFN